LLILARRSLDKNIKRDYPQSFETGRRENSMPLMKRSSGMLFFFMLVGGLLGGVLSEILLLLSPTGFLKDLFIKGFQIGIPTATLDLHLISLTFGFGFKINLLSILGIALGLYTYKQV
jgi:hypothetical protein